MNWNWLVWKTTNWCLGNPSNCLSLPDCSYTWALLGATRVERLRCRRPWSVTNPLLGIQPFESIFLRTKIFWELRNLSNCYLLGACRSWMPKTDWVGSANFLWSFPPSVTVAPQRQRWFESTWHQTPNLLCHDCLAFGLGMTWNTIPLTHLDIVTKYV